jgi:hypothetical protein
MSGEREEGEGDGGEEKGKKRAMMKDFEMLKRKRNY